MSELPASEPDLSELESLRRENAALRQQLGLAVAEAPVQSWAVTVELPLEDRSQTTLGKASAVQDKIALFRSLFRGREDVYGALGKRAEREEGLCSRLRGPLEPEGTAAHVPDLSNTE